jgi:hypothetical protein
LQREDARSLACGVAATAVFGTAREPGEISRARVGKPIACRVDMRAAVLSVALIGCAYSPGSFSHFRQDFPGQRTTVGCLDLAVDRRPDLTTGGAVLAYEFGNRCDRPATVDFTHVAVKGRTYDGKELALTAYDPEWQIKPLQIDGRTGGKEAIAYLSDEPLAEVCVDAASLTHEAPARWLCFESRLPPPVDTSEHVAEVAP